VQQSDCKWSWYGRVGRALSQRNPSHRRIRRARAPIFFDLANHLYPHVSQPPGTLFPGATLPIDGDQLARIARRAPNTKTHSTPLPRPTPPHYPPTRLVNSVLAINTLPGPPVCCSSPNALD